MILYALLTALGLLIVIWKLPRQYRDPLLARGWLMDAIISLGVLTFFAGTYSGMMVAVVAGIAVSAALPVMALLAGVRQASRTKAKHQRPQPPPRALAPDEPIPLLWRLEAVDLSALLAYSVTTIRFILIAILILFIPGLMLWIASAGW